MKKILALILAIGMIFTLVACSGSNGGEGNEGEGGEEATQTAGDLDYANMTEDDLIKEFIKDPANVTAEEYANLVSTLSYVEITEELNLKPQSITIMAIKKLKDDKATLPKLEEYVETLLKSDAPQVRGYALSQMGSILGIAGGHVDLAKEILKTETEPYVLREGMLTLRTEGEKDPEIGQFLLNCAKNEDPRVRATAASAISINPKLEGAYEAIIELMNDPELSVKKEAYRNAGNLNDERVIEPIVAILKDESEPSLHGSGIEALVKLWYDYPRCENASEAAYRATMDYLKTQSDNENIPYWTAVISFQNKTSSEDKFAEWKQKATYYNPDEIYEVMVGIVKDENLNSQARSYASKPVATHCTREQFDAFGEIINGLTGDQSDINDIKNIYEVEKEKLDEN